VLSYWRSIPASGKVICSASPGGTTTAHSFHFGKAREISCTKALRKMLDGLDRDSTVVLTTKTNRPWKPRYFKAQWELASKKAGITNLHFHDLRGTAVTMLVQANCTTPHIAAITGHSLKTVTTILDEYLARTRVLAGEAVTLFENAKSARFANRLQTRTPRGKKGAVK
jgi:integrase